MKDDRTTDKGAAYDPLIAAANAVQFRASLAVEIASAAADIQIIILQGMVNAGVVDRQAMRAWLQSAVNELSPPERLQTYGRFLSRLIAWLNDHQAPRAPLTFH